GRPSAAGGSVKCQDCPLDVWGGHRAVIPVSNALKCFQNDYEMDQQVGLPEEFAVDGGFLGKLCSAEFFPHERA
ncbi:MAG: hypothetical protein ACM335_12165, partial [Deltaproteobacteria bacterium]